MSFPAPRRARGTISPPPEGLGRRHLVALSLGVALTGCGFRPVYMPTASGKAGPAQRELAAVYVNIIPDRPGQLLRQALQERLGSDSGAEPLRYRLSVSYTISGEGIGITSGTIPTRIRLIGVANWVLRMDDSTQAQVTSGSARDMDALNVLDQQYFAADLATEQAQNRMASRVADQIAMQLAVFFRRRAGLPSG